MNICASCTLEIPYSQLLPLFKCFGNNMFSNCIKHHKVQKLLIGVLVPLTVCSIDKTNIFLYIIYEKCSFHS